MFVEPTTPMRGRLLILAPAGTPSPSRRGARVREAAFQAKGNLNPCRIPPRFHGSVDKRLRKIRIAVKLPS
jgi:hypothetical protein